VAEITVTAGAGSRDGAVFEVGVHDAGDVTSHTVTVPRGVPAGLGWDEGRTEELVRASFAFLLEREPARSILRRFNLEVIGDYFPEYPDEMARRARVLD
jgi:hypothetical protein